MTRGPKPAPAAVKEAKGNPGRRPIGADPQPTAADAGRAIAPPAWLKRDGLRVWKRLAPRLQAMRLLTETDAETFARYCRNFARWLKMQAILDKEGETYESESAHGKLKRAHPAYMIGDRLEKQLSQAEASFGLNPADRQRLYAARVNAPLSLDLPPPADKKSAEAPAKPAAATGTGVGFLN